jgi:hypothetical protein
MTGPTPSTTPSPSRRRAGALPLILFLLFWSAITGAFDVMATRGIAAQLHSRSFTPTPASILSSEIEEHSSTDGTTYSPKITYRYSAAGAEHTSDRYSFGDMATSSHRRAKDATLRYPAGATTTAYVDPADPSRATLRTGIEGTSLFLVLFLLPFNAVGIIGWKYAISRATRPARPAGGLLLRDDSRTALLRLSHADPFDVFVGSLGAIAFVAIFVVAIAFGFSASTPTVAIALGIVLGLALLCTAREIRAVASGRHDLIIDRTLASITLPRRKQDLLPRTFGFDTLQAIELCDHPRADDDTTATFTVRLRASDLPEPEVLLAHTSEEPAKDLAAWLAAATGAPRQELPLPLPERRGNLHTLFRHRIESANSPPSA